MRILVIDDERTFKFPAVYARNSWGADVWLRTEPWDIVCFDHDLGGLDTIKPVLELIEFRAWLGVPLPIGECVVHTMNPVGRDMLVRVLSKYYKTRVVDVNELLAV